MKKLFDWKRHNLRGLEFLISLVVGISLMAACTKEEVGNSYSAQPIIKVIDNFGMIAFEGLDCDMASLMSSGDGKYMLYIANAKFVPELKNEISEITSTYNSDTQVAHVEIIYNTTSGGTIEGPRLTFEVECDTGAVLCEDSIPYENQTLTLDKKEMWKLGKLTKNLLQIGEAAEQFMLYQNDTLRREA